MTAQRSNMLSVDVSPQLEVRLPDWFEAGHDPGGVISRMVIRLDQLALRRGSRWYPQTDFWALKEVQTANRAHGTITQPHIDPVHSDLTPENAFWILGIDEAGAPATTQTGLMFDWHDTTLAKELESYRFFYRDPKRVITEDCYCRIPRPAGDQISGTVVHSGGMWVRPDMRGPGDVGIVLSQVLGKLTRLVAISRWWPDFLVMFAAVDLYNRGVVSNFGWTHGAFKAEYKLPGHPPYAAGLFWMEIQELLNWAEEELRRPAAA
jgi:hypothetical protein